MGQNPSPFAVSRRFKIGLIALVIVSLPGCATMPTHQFAEPTADWHTKTGQLMYRTPQTTLIGDVLVRYSNAGDFQLIMSKGPGVTLLSLREDAQFAEIKGPLAHSGWSGRVQEAPTQLRGWVALRNQIIRSQGQRTMQYVASGETFLFRF